MLPEINIFGLIIDSYVLFFFLGGLIASFGGYFFGISRGLDKKKLFLILLLTSVFAFVGARLFNFVLHRKIYEQNPELLLNFNMQGQAIIGGIIFAYISIFLLSKLFRQDYWKIGDSLAPFVGLGLIFGRIGCLLAGCCFGKETDLSIGIKFPLFSLAHKYQLAHNPGQLFSSHPVHPTQIYEMIAGFLIFVISLIILKKSQKNGITVLVASIIYFVFRLVDNYFRAPAMTYSVPDWFYPSFYGIFILIFGILLGIKLKEK
ncbi:MAG: prolipoprotein diacylglyceryl transferase [Candidatus Gracilibacteria bacterium]|nr:prolipoprotein diacylglyceryl transferase [Candidatus Gracilibacteria bacterium]